MKLLKEEKVFKQLHFSETKSDEERKSPRRRKVKSVSKNCSNQFLLIASKKKVFACAALAFSAQIASERKKN